MDNGACKPGLPELFYLFTIDMTIIHSNRKIHTANLIVVFQLVTKKKIKIKPDTNDPIYIYNVRFGD